MISIISDLQGKDAFFYFLDLFNTRFYNLNLWPLADIPASSPALLMSVISGSRTVLLPADKGSIVAFDGPFHNVIA